MVLGVLPEWQIISTFAILFQTIRCTLTPILCVTFDMIIPVFYSSRDHWNIILINKCKKIAVIKR